MTDAAAPRRASAARGARRMLPRGRSRRFPDRDRGTPRPHAAATVALASGDVPLTGASRRRNLPPRIVAVAHHLLWYAFGWTCGAKTKALMMPRYGALGHGGASQM